MRRHSELTVLHIAQPVAGGVPRCVELLVRDQVSHGWCVSVAAPSKSQLTDLAKAAGARVLTWEATRQPGVSVAHEVRRLRAILRHVKPDIVHLHSAKAGLCGRLVVRGRTPTIFEPNGWSFHAVRGLMRQATVAWERAAARWTHAVVCVSERERDDGLAVGIPGPFTTIPNAVDVDRFAQASAADRVASRMQLGLDDSPLVVCVGRLSRQKGQDLLLEAWRSVLERVPGGHLVLVGDGPERPLLESKSPNQVTFVGEQRDVRPWLAVAEVVVLPSRWEGMSLVLLEAMATGRSIVATDVQGVREAMGRVSGAVVAPEDVRSLADALALRLSDVELREREGRNARARAERLYSPEARGQRIAELYHDLGVTFGGK